MNGKDFAMLLDRAIARSGKARVVPQLELKAQPEPDDGR
jgi:hypothetical protein